ncbi:MAG: hypothetical protein RL398_1453 [Planctomycetota bacterium]
MNLCTNAVAAAAATLCSACDGAAMPRETVDMLFALDVRAAASHPQPALVEAGRRAFAAPQPGGSCASCHPLDELGSDGQLHGRATPPLADVARQTQFGWDGAIADLPTMIRHEAERHQGRVLEAEEAASIAAFLTAWRTRGRWDRFVEGDDDALSPAEQSGLHAFVTTGCAACHGGRNLGGRSRHKLGAAEPHPVADQGLFERTGLAADRWLFRAPMLRHAAATAPYLHDHSLTDLEATVVFMARHELGKAIDAATASSIARFLRAVGDRDPDAVDIAASQNSATPNGGGHAIAIR